MPGLDLPSPPWIIGHRGAAGEALENTLESLRLAIDQEADMLELDLQLTTDRRLVAFHDRYLQLTDGSERAIEDLSTGDLAGLEYLEHQRVSRPGEGIPTLELVLHSLPASTPLNLELKRHGADHETFSRTLVRAITGRDQILVSSFDWDLLTLIRKRLPSLPVAPIADQRWRPLLEAAAELAAFTVHCHRRLARRRLFEEAAQAGRPTLVFTVNRPAHARQLLERGAAGVFTDFPGRLRQKLALT